MGFSTSAMYCLMSHTPVIRAEEVARFLRQFHLLRLVKSDSPHQCSIKYGRRPDKNDRELIEQIPMRGIRGMYSFREQRCDLKTENDKTFVDVAELLERIPKKRIYRASIYLGSVLPGFTERVYARSDQNDRAVSLDAWMIHIGPQIVSDPNSDTGDRFHLGYLSVSLSGQGYCMPRTPREVMDCVRAQREIQSIEQLCQSIWPARPRNANSGVIKMRSAMGTLWPYDELDRPVEWNWVIEEDF